MTANVPAIGRRVLFTEHRNGRQIIHDAWITNVAGDGVCDLRVHRFAQKDLDFAGVPFSPEVRAGHWTWRSA